MKHSSVVCLDTHIRNAWYSQTFGVSLALHSSAKMKATSNRLVHKAIDDSITKVNAKEASR